MIRFKEIHFECPPFLFGYGWWSTLWRFAVVVLTQVAVMLIAALNILYFFVYDMAERVNTSTIYAFIIMHIVLIVSTAIILYITHRINKRNYRKNKELFWLCNR